MVPDFDSEFLAEIAEAFRKRRTSFKRRGAGPEIYKDYQQQSGDLSERLEIVLEDGTQENGAVLRLNATHDRNIVLAARRKPWGGATWNWEYDGKLLGSYTGRDAIAALAKSLVILPRINSSNMDLLAAPWARLLARGPRKV